MSVIKPRTLCKVFGNTDSLVMGAHFKDIVSTIVGFGEGTLFTSGDVADCFATKRQHNLLLILAELRNIRILQEEGETIARAKLFRVSDEAMRLDVLKKYLTFENYFSSTRARRLACSMLDQLAEVRPETTYLDLATALGRNRNELYPVMRKDELKKLNVVYNELGTVPLYVSLNSNGVKAAEDMMKLSVALKQLNRKSPMAQHLYS